MKMKGGDSDAFCMTMDGGMGRVMLMGFQTAWGKDAMCINYLFEGWALDTAGKYAAAVIATFAMAFLNQAVTLGRRRYRGSVTTPGTSSTLVDGLIYGVQMVFAYFMMLLAMTYEVIIFSSIILGLVCGQVVWGGIVPRWLDGKKEQKGSIQADNEESQGLLVSGGENDVTGNTPCCGGTATGEWDA
jgi:Ctr copper transporter family